MVEEVITNIEKGEDIVLSATESIKLVKNSRGYTWEIRVVRKYGETDEEYLKRLTNLNNRLMDLTGE